MAASEIVRVPLAERGYEIEIGSGNLATVDAFLRARMEPSRTLVVTDEQVGPLYADAVTERLRAAGCDGPVLTIPAGESSKSIDQFARLCGELLEHGADRNSVIVALGGGVVGDLAGFVAASYARGIPFFQIPTTLLAQVDSSVGGKTGVNLPGAKNMVGAFWQPVGVVIDTRVLQTLPDREYRAGLSEVVKYGVIVDASLFDYLEDHVDELNRKSDAELRHVVARCCQLKASIVVEDERETTGRRAVLNYGHTFAHALETATEYGQLLHGEAVAIGMQCAARLAARLGRIDETVVERQAALLESLGLERGVPDLDRDALMGFMLHDKKTVAGRLRLVLPSRLGHVELVDDVDPADVRAAWD